MKKRTTGTLLVLLTVICALWVTPVLANTYNITGYTASLLVTDPTGAILGGDTGLNGYYSIDLTGPNSSSLSATLTLYNANLDGSRNLINPTVAYTGALVDNFYFTYVNDIFTLGSTQLGDMMQLSYAALAADPNYPGVLGQRGLLNGNNAYVNQLYLDPNGVPFSYDQAGLPTSPTTVYGAIIVPDIFSTDIFGNLIDLPVEDASAPVPEPSTFLLLAAGLGGMCFLRRRRA